MKRHPLLTPKWIVSHVLMAGAIGLAIWAGFWQLDRLDQRKDRNAQIEARQAEPEVGISELVSAGDLYSVADAVRYRNVRAAGRYQLDDEVLVRNRSLEGSAGFWVLTPLLFGDGSAVVVNRGWVPFSMGPGQPRGDATAPVGSVEVSGVVEETVTAGRFQVSDSAAGRLDSLARVDLARYADQLDYPILPVYIRLVDQVPAQGSGLPARLPEPDLGEGPHLSYAVQWFSFALIGAVGYPLILRPLATRASRKKRPSQVPVDYL
jgi:surfeit locus 1 family protein